MPHAAHPRLLPGANSGVREQSSLPFAKANPRSRSSSSCIKAYLCCIMMQTQRGDRTLLACKCQSGPGPVAASPARTFTSSRFNPSIRRWTNPPWRTSHAAAARAVASARSEPFLSSSNSSADFFSNQLFFTLLIAHHSPLSSAFPI